MAALVKVSVLPPVELSRLEAGPAGVVPRVEASREGASRAAVRAVAVRAVAVRAVGVTVRAVVVRAEGGYSCSRRGQPV